MKTDRSTNRVANLAEWCLILVAAAYLAYLYPWEQLLRATVTAGGDTASHYYPAWFMHHELLPKGQLTGWTMGNYAGFPIFHFYSTLPFFLIAAGGYLFPMEQTFKIVSLLGATTLPIAVGYLFRVLGYGRGAAVMAAGSVLPFLFQQGNSMWGGNIPSVLAGEFCHSIGLTLSFVFLAELHKASRGTGSWIRAAFVLAAVGLSHAFAFIGALWFGLYYVWPRAGLPDRARQVAPVALLAFLLLCFWGLPLPPRVRFTTEWSVIWNIRHLKEVVPELLWPAGVLTLANLFAMIPRPEWTAWWSKDRTLPLAGTAERFARGALGLAGLAVLAWHWRIWTTAPETVSSTWQAGAAAGLALLCIALPRKRFDADRHGLFLFILFGAGFLYLLAPAVGFPDIRFIPLAQIVVGLMAADFLGWTAKRLRFPLVYAAVVLTATLAWSHHHIGYLPSWLHWNYSGYEGKVTWDLFKSINDHARGDVNSPRMVFEHSQMHNRFGGSRAFENLPFFAGRSTLEGVFHQVSPNSAYAFYIQSEVSEKTSGPFPQYTYMRLNPDAALPHLRHYNVGTIVAVTQKARAAYDAHPSFERTFLEGGYAIYEIEGGDTGYVEAARNAPVLFVDDDPPRDTTGAFAGLWRDLAAGETVTSAFTRWRHLMFDHKDYKISFYRWFKHPELLDVPLVPKSIIGEDAAREFALTTETIRDIPREPYAEDCKVTSDLEHQRIRFRTTCPGRPHIVKVSYFPRWKTADGSPVHLVSPGFMLVYPSGEDFEMYYGRTTLDWFALTLTWIGLIWAFAAAVSARVRTASETLVGVPIGLALGWMERRAVLWSCIGLVLLSLIGAATRFSLTRPDEAYGLAQEAYKARQFERAVDLLQEWTATDRETFKQATALYQLGVAQSELDQHESAIESHERLLFEFPNINYGAGTLFHMAKNYAATGRLDSGRKAAAELIRQFPEGHWTKRLLREEPALAPEADQADTDDVKPS